MALTKKIGHGIKLIAAKTMRKRIPLIVNWAITGKCNLRCIHCYGAYGITQKDELTTDQVFTIIDELKSIGTRRITIEGGEPLMRKDIGDIIDYIHQKGIEQSLCTNGVLLERKIDQVKGKVDIVILSIDGAEQTHDYIRGRGNFKQVLHAIDVTKNAGLRTLIFYTLMDENLNDLDEVIELVKQLGIFIAFNIAVAKITSDGKRISLPKESEQKYREAIRNILEYKKKGYPIFYSDKNFLQALHWKSYTKERLYPEDLPKYKSEPLIPCYAGKYFAYIECNGDVYPCYQLVGTMPVKNAVKDGFKSAFDHLAKVDYCLHCYNITISELNLQSGLDFQSVVQVLQNYLKK
ncbi:MAG: radical SAM protein [bacterium]|nr:radical SAM protein [bacterium]